MLTCSNTCRIYFLGFNARLFMNDVSHTIKCKSKLYIHLPDLFWLIKLLYFIIISIKLITVAIEKKFYLLIQCQMGFYQFLVCKN